MALSSCTSPSPTHSVVCTDDINLEFVAEAPFQKRSEIGGIYI